MVHLRIVAPEAEAKKALALFEKTDSVYNVIVLENAARKPEGHAILCDVAREDASVVIADLKEMGIHHCGSIAIEDIDSQISDVAIAAEKAAAGLPTDAVVWEEVEARTSENVELSGNFLAFMVVATLIAAVGLLTDQVILIIGAMVVGPEFGPLAGLCVALVHKRSDMVKRSILALAVGFPLAIICAFVMTLLLDLAGLVPDGFSQESHRLTEFISSPDEFSVIVAALAGVAGILSLTAAKSGALIGVLISVTTLPAAANIGIAVALGDTKEGLGSLAQLAINLTVIVLSGVATLYFQRKLYIRRKAEHHSDEGRKAAGLSSTPQKS
ncbi:MAG TPA: TIGR00341 family protein [Solirubrobacterales bacterium]|nr:TIGR00341 family protein [Solirubrobacterales bacterium]